jgi:hypothetical protein
MICYSQQEKQSAHHSDWDVSQISESEQPKLFTTKRLLRVCCILELPSFCRLKAAGSGQEQAVNTVLLKAEDYNKASPG